MLSHSMPSPMHPIPLFLKLPALQITPLQMLRANWTKMEILVGIIFSTFTKETSQAESDERISWLLQLLDKPGTDSLTAGRGGAGGKSSLSLHQNTHPLFTCTSASFKAKTPVLADEGLTVNLHHHCRWPPCLALVLDKPSLTRTSLGCSGEQEHCHFATEMHGHYLCWPLSISK